MPSKLHKLFIVLAVLSLLGFVDASYLTAKAYLGTPIRCAIFAGCDTVTRSAYSKIGPVPVALLGAMFYLAIIILSLAYFDTKKPSIVRAIGFVSPIGFLASLWFVYVQFFILHSICLYCMISALTSTAIFITGFAILKVHGRRETSGPVSTD